MIDYSFLKLSSTIAEAQNIGDSPIVTHYELSSIQLLPNRTYLQITNFNGGISLDNDCEVFVVDCNDNVLADITDNVFIEEFVDSNGNNQCKIEYVNLNVDFYRQTVHIKFDMLSSNAVYYTNPINITAYQENETVFFKYKNYDDFKGIGYTNANVWQSISLRMWFDIPIDNTEVEDYFQISRENTISARALMKLFERYQIDYCNRFTFDRLNVLLKHELIYLDSVRVTNKPVVTSEDREGDSNFWQTNFEVAKNYNDTSLYDYQIFNGLQITSILPSTLATPCTIELDAKVNFNIPITLNTGTITIYDASDNSVVRTFTESDMSIEVSNQLYIADFLVPQLLNGNYYVYISAGLVSGLGIDFEGISDTTTWAFSLTDGQFNRLQFNNTQFLVDCPAIPDPINDNLVLFYKFNETSGTVATDSSTFFNNGTINGAEINQTGLIDKCYRFNNTATDQYVEVPDAPSLNFGNGAFGIEVWINASANFGQILNKYNISTGNLQYRLFIQSGVLQFFIYTDASNRIGIADNVTITTGAWQQIFITYDGSGLASGLKMWVDNVPASFSPIMTGTYTGMTPTSQSLILAQQADDLAGANRYSGLMDILRIWKGYAPTEAEKTTLYNSGNGTES